MLVDHWWLVDNLPGNAPRVSQSWTTTTPAAVSARRVVRRRAAVNDSLVGGQVDRLLGREDDRLGRPVDPPHRQHGHVGHRLARPGCRVDAHLRKCINRREAISTDYLLCRPFVSWVYF